jgi:hypothetical protein
MCFSTAASFGSCAILAVAGVATLKKVEVSSQLLFAAIPIIFCIQQFIEGFVWITLTNHNYADWQNVPIYAFAFFAQVLWPVWVPLSFLLIEKSSNRKKVLLIFLIIGSLLSVYHAYCLLFYPTGAAITPYHIHYRLDFPQQYMMLNRIMYVLPVLIPPFISSLKKTSILGVLLLTSFLITKLYFDDYLISVWCFFAALVSAYVFLIMKDLKAKDNVSPVFTNM